MCLNIRAERDQGVPIWLRLAAMRAAPTDFLVAAQTKDEIVSARGASSQRCTDRDDRLARSPHR
jgi:hypothetical protein